VRILLAIGSTLLLLSSSAVAETTITFDPAPTGPLIGALVRIDAYSEGGLIFTADPFPGSTIHDDSLGVPSNGTAFVLKCGICKPSMQAIDGGPFDLLSIELGEPLFFGFGPFATAGQVVGIQQDGSIVSVDFVTDGTRGFEQVDIGLFDLV
jgi:hypothetical protein